MLGEIYRKHVSNLKRFMCMPYTQGEHMKCTSCIQSHSSHILIVHQCIYECYVEISKYYKCFVIIKKREIVDFRLDFDNHQNIYV